MVIAYTHFVLNYYAICYFMMVYPICLVGSFADLLPSLLVNKFRKMY